MAPAPAPGRTILRTFVPVNTAVRDAQDAVRGQTRRRPELLGCSVFTYDDVYRRLGPILRAVRVRGYAAASAGAGASWETPPPVPRLYAVACDISRAFDTVPLEKLQQVVEETLQDDQYRVLSYAQAS